MEQKTFFALVLMMYLALLSFEGVSSRSHGLKYQNHHNYNSNHYRNHNSQQNGEESSGEQVKSYPKHAKLSATSWGPSDDDYEYEDGGRHAYLMTREHKKSSAERVTEDQTLTKAFEKHMKPGTANAHDVYAYQLPSDLWFVVRYSKGDDGQTEKYMNVVDSFTNYLEKLDKSVQTVSVNVKGVETVFRLSPKQRKTDN